MKLQTLLFTSGLTLLPIFELRGGIPYAQTQGVHPLFAYFFCVAVNAAVCPLVFLFLSTLHKALDAWPVYHSLFSRIVERARTKIQKKVQKYGYVGVMLFVAIPLPVTGAYTGALGAWVLGMERKKSFLAISLGVCIAGIIVSLVAFFGIKAFSLFIK